MEEPTEAWSMDLRDRRMWLAFLAVVSGLVPRLDEHHKRAVGISHHEFTVLVMIAEAEDATAELSSIARRTGASLSRISHTVRRLERDGRLTLGRSARDARATTATLTEAGTSASKQDSRLGKYARDVLMYRTHIGAQSDALYAANGRSVITGEPPTT